MTRNQTRIVAAFATATFAVALGFSTPGRQHRASADAPPNNAQLKALYGEKCSACHDLPDPEEKGFTKAQWQSTVQRMLTAHGASNSISDVQAAQIVNYLGEFAPRPGQSTNNDIGVWQNDPAVSAAYPFTYPPNLQSFTIAGGGWKIIQTPDIVSGYLKHAAAGGTALLIENKHTLQGGLDIEVQFHVNSFTAGSTVGLIFGATDAKNYLSAEYAPSTGAITLSKVTDGQPSQLQQATFASTDASSTNDWHSFRVKVTEGGTAVEVLMDYQREIKTSYPAWQGGRVGLDSNGPIVAAFRQFTIDSYQSNLASPAGDVLLH